MPILFKSFITFCLSLPNIEVRPSVEEVQKMLCQVNLFKSGSILAKLTLFKRGKHLHKIKTTQVGQTILSVCKGVAQWKGVGKQTKQAVQQEVVKELARTVGMSFKFSKIFCILGREESSQETVQPCQDCPASDRGKGFKLLQTGE